LKQILKVTFFSADVLSLKCLFYIRGNCDAWKRIYHNWDQQRRV